MRKWTIRAAVALPLLVLIAILVTDVWRRHRMPQNQTLAAAACKQYAEAQELYRRVDYDGDGVLEYAQQLSALTNLGLMPAIAGADMDNPNAVPANGYVFRILTRQGEKATGGPRSYIAGSNMTLGYALVAAPHVYDVTGRDTFVISNNGTIFQKDLGERITMQRLTVEFNPDDIGLWG
jgi:hypothetical protein